MGLIVYEAIHLQVRQSGIIYSNVFWSISPLFYHFHLALPLQAKKGLEKEYWEAGNMYMNECESVWDFCPLPREFRKISNGEIFLGPSK